MSNDAVTISVRLTPRGGRDAVIGWRGGDGVLLLRVAAPPVGGAANAACRELLARALGVRRGQVTPVGGATSRDKRFRVEGMTAATWADLRASLPTVKGGGRAGDGETHDEKESAE